VGVDVETVRDRVNFLRLAMGCFAAQEVRSVTNCASRAEQLACFYRLWTRKEAFAKAVGMGLALPFITNLVSGRSSLRWPDCGAPQASFWELRDLCLEVGRVGTVAFERSEADRGCVFLRWRRLKGVCHAG
jgi:4'-phosphopantetheinyl transferase